MEEHYRRGEAANPAIHYATKSGTKWFEILRYAAFYPQFRSMTVALQKTPGKFSVFDFLISTWPSSPITAVDDALALGEPFFRIVDTQRRNGIINIAAVELPEHQLIGEGAVFLTARAAFSAFRILRMLESEH